MKDKTSRSGIKKILRHKEVKKAEGLGPRKRLDRDVKSGEVKYSKKKQA